MPMSSSSRTRSKPSSCSGNYTCTDPHAAEEDRTRHAFASCSSQTCQGQCCSETRRILHDCAFVENPGAFWRKPPGHTWLTCLMGWHNRVKASLSGRQLVATTELGASFPGVMSRGPEVLRALRGLKRCRRAEGISGQRKRLWQIVD